MLRKLVICRTDGIGDVILTLPTAAMMKMLYPGLKICFVGRSYTAPVIAACEHIDEFIDWDEHHDHTLQERVLYFKSLHADAIVYAFPDREIARTAFHSKIPLRVGTSHRFHHWLYCNRLVNLGRKRSPLHEAQLNALLFRPLGAAETLPLDALTLMTGLTRPVELDETYARWIDSGRFNIILHPATKGSAREWGVENFVELIRLLPPERYKIFISGTREEGVLLQPLFEMSGGRVQNITGEMPLGQFISFISRIDGLVAASTGPLHIAAALGKAAIGLYAPMRPIDPGRWAPLGTNSRYLVVDKKCRKCRHDRRCECIEEIRPADVMLKLEQMIGC